MVSLVLKPKQLASLFLIAILIVSLQLAFERQNFLQKKTYSLDDDAKREIDFLRDYFGVANSSLIVVTRDSDSRLEIGYRVSPASIYYGNLMYLLMNRTDPFPLNLPSYVGGLESLQVFDALGESLLQNYTIALTEHTYYPSSFEKQLLIEISPGVYVVKKNIIEEEIMQIFVYSQIMNTKEVSGDSITLGNAINSTDLFVNAESKEYWIALNDKNPISNVTLDMSLPKEGQYSVKGTYTDTVGGYNIHLRYDPPSYFELSENDSLVVFMRTDFFSEKMRIYIACLLYTSPSPRD